MRISLPVQLLLIVGAVALGGQFVSPEVTSFFFTISSCIKELLEFFLPLIVYTFVTTGVVALKQNALMIVLLLVGFSFVSSLITSMIAYGVGIGVLSIIGDTAASFVPNTSSAIKSLFSFGLHPLVRVEYALLGAVITGMSLIMLSGTTYARVMQTAIRYGKNFSEFFLRQLFIPILPLYILGFFLKLYVDAPFSVLCQLYGILYVLAIVVEWTLFSTLFYIGAGSVKRAWNAIVVAFPSYLTGLGTMSSIASLPVSTVCAEINTNNRPLVECGMPILTNVHLLGDAISVPLFTLGTFLVFTHTLPTVGEFFVFALSMCVTLLAASGVPGGGIIVMVPLLKSMFHFSPEMLGVMTALYLLHDSFGTAANVMGDGAMVMVVNRVMNYFTQRGADERV